MYERLFENDWEKRKVLDFKNHEFKNLLINNVFILSYDFIC